MFGKICISSTLLIAGTLIYVLFRQQVLFLTHIPSDLLAKIKINIDYSNCTAVTYFLIFCLPDALWYAALLIFQSALLEKNITAKFIFIASVLLPFIYEMMQKASLIPGTFDWMDIFTYLLTLLILFLCQKKHFYQLLH